MLILGECFKTQSDQNIHQNTPKCSIFSKKILGGASIMSLNPLSYARNYN